MLFRKIDVQAALEKEREQVKKEWMMEVHSILENHRQSDVRIHSALRDGSGGTGFLHSEDLDANGIFSSEEIRRICLKYRMRFLPVKHFKGEIPYEANIRIRELQEAHHIELGQFRILAPRRLFELADADADPMLFVPTADGNYYLIHKWGTDMQWHRRLLSWPMQSLENYFKALLVLVAIISLITPTQWITPDNPYTFNGFFDYWGYHRAAYFMYVLIAGMGISVFILASFHRNFSEVEWNRKTFN
jgi:hypothetical protein